MGLAYDCLKTAVPYTEYIITRSTDMSSSDKKNKLMIKS